MRARFSTTPKLLIALLAVIGLAPAALLAAPADLTTVVPENTLVYIGRTGCDHADKVGKDTAFGKLCAEPEVQRCVKHICGIVDQIVATEAGDSGDEAKAYEIGKELLGVVVRRPAAIALIDGGIGPKGPFAHAALIVHVGPGGKDFLRRVDTLLDLGKAPKGDVALVAGHSMTRLGDGKPAWVYYGLIGEHFIAAVGEEAIKQVAACIAGKAETLAANKSLAAARSKMAGDAASASWTVHVNVATAFDRAKRSLAHCPDREAEELAQVLGAMTALGIEGLHSVTWESRLTGGGCYSGLYLHLPGERKGLFAMQTSQALTDDDLVVIPKEPTWAAAFNVDLAAIYRGILSAVGSIDKGLGETIAGPIKGIEEMLGFSLDEGFLSLIGDTIIVYDAPENGGLLFTGATFVVESSDAKTLAKRLSKIVQVIGNGFGAGYMRLGSTKHGDQDVEFINIIGLPMPVAPAWAVHEDKLVFGLYPQMVTAALDRLAGGHPREESILANADFVAARKIIGPMGSSMSYVNTRAAFQGAYPFLLLLAQIGAAMGQGEGLEIDISALPSQRTLAKHMFNNVKTTRSDTDGILYASYGPLPFGVSPVVTGNMATTATLVSVLLPSLSRARELSKRTVCGANLRGIGQAMYISAQDDDQFPSSFQVLLDEGNSTEKQLICPSSAAVPGDALDACYVLVPGQSLSDDFRNVLVYEKRLNHSDEEGGNVLFLDGHVEFISPYSRVEELVAETQQRLDKAKKKKQDE